MGETIFTPGPWTLSKRFPSWCVNAEKEMIADEILHEANANLIAAAPAMYAALVDAQKRLRGAGMLGSGDDPVNAALAKSRGETE